MNPRGQKAVPAACDAKHPLPQATCCSLLPAEQFAEPAFYAMRDRGPGFAQDRLGGGLDRVPQSPNGFPLHGRRHVLGAGFPCDAPLFFFGQPMDDLLDQDLQVVAFHGGSDEDLGQWHVEQLADLHLLAADVGQLLRAGHTVYEVPLPARLDLVYLIHHE